MSLEYLTEWPVESSLVTLVTLLRDCETTMCCGTLEKRDIPVITDCDLKEVMSSYFDNSLTSTVSFTPVHCMDSDIILNKHDVSEHK